MSYEAKGRIESCGDVQRVTDKFSKREFTLTIDGKYPQLVRFETNGKALDAVTPLDVGQPATVHFELQGRRSAKGQVWNTLRAWKVEVEAPKSEEPPRHEDPPPRPDRPRVPDDDTSDPPF